MPVFGVVIATVVQASYIRRTSKLFVHGRRMLGFVSFTGILVLASVIGATFTTFNLYESSSSESTSPLLGAKPYTVYVNLWLWCGMAVDVAISTTLWYLLRSRVAGFNRNTDSILFRLMRLAIQSASYTALISFVGAVATVVVDGSNVLQTSIPAPFWLPLPACYTCSYFTTLSAQDRIKQDIRTGLMTERHPQRTPLDTRSGRVSVNKPHAAVLKSSGSTLQERRSRVTQSTDSVLVQVEVQVDEVSMGKLELETEAAGRRGWRNRPNGQQDV